MADPRTKVPLVDQHGDTLWTSRVGTALYTRVRAAARAEGITYRAWVERAFRRELERTGRGGRQ
ncbi:MAG: hypothetical protein ACREEC_02000 [Thermoplasmata archaeon]